MRKVLIAGLLLITMIMATGCSYEDDDYAPDGVELRGSTAQSAQPSAPTTTNRTEGPATSADGVVACTAADRHLTDKNFTYTVYQCATDNDYSELGDYILSLIASSYGILFLDDVELDEWDFDFEFTADEEVELVVYAVTGNKLGAASEGTVPITLRGLQTNRASHEELWQQITRLIPSEHRTDLVEFAVFAHDGTVGYVNQNLYDDKVSSDWIYALNVLDAEPELERYSTIIHEFAHIMTLRATQVMPYVGEADCAWLFLEEGCSKPESYIQRFYEQFWVDIYEQVASYDGDPDQLEDFYLARIDQFVNDYAATSLLEDVAESFSYFVLQPMPHGNALKDAKIRFFYDYPELVSLRVEILSRLATMIKESQ